MSYTLGLILEGSGMGLPEDAAGEEDLILHLVGGGAGDLHAVLVLLLQLVPHVVGLGDVAPVVNLETERAVCEPVGACIGGRPASPVTSSRPGPGPWICIWGFHRDRSWCPHTPRAPGRR